MTNGQEPVLILAPGSLAPVRAALQAGFAATAALATLRFGEPAYSGLLAAAIAGGAPADLFISANLRYLQELSYAGLAPDPRILAHNALSLVVRADLAPRLRTLADCLAPGRRLAVPPAATDPLGEYISQMVSLAGLDAALAAKRRRGEVLEHLAEVPARFAAGSLDAAVVYRTSAGALAPGAVPVPLPATLTLADDITFGVGIIVRDGATHPAAAQALAYLLGPAGQAVLLAAGFLPASGRGTWPHG